MTTPPMPTDPIRPAMIEVVSALHRRAYDFYVLVTSQHSLRCPESIYEHAHKCVALAYALKVLNERVEANERESA